MKRKPEKAIAYNPEWSPERSRERYRWVENASKGLRVVGASHEIIKRLGHNGWYLDDEFQDETVHGVVLQLPAQDGEALFVPAVADPFNVDCYVVNFNDWYKETGDDTESAKRDCALAADEMARCYAEREREWRGADRARQCVEDAREGICTARALVARLARDLRTLGSALPPSSREIVRQRIHAERENVARLVKVIRADGWPA